MYKAGTYIGLALLAFVIWVMGHGQGYETAIAEYARELEAQVEQRKQQNFTGYDVFEAINEYRAEQGVAPLIMDEALCNNIAQRWIYYKEHIDGKSNTAHRNLNEFVVEHMPNVGQVTEILATGRSAEHAVQGWASSPSHNIPLLENTHGCTYAAEGAAVALLSSYSW